MATSPRALTIEQWRARLGRVKRIAKDLGFVGAVEYRHVYSRAGGAQYGRGRTPEEDLLIVYAEAFDKDADPDEFSLAAIVAHERGHQILARHPRIAKRVAGRISERGEEVLASLLGGMICEDEADRDALIAKAAAQLVSHGQSLEITFQQLQRLKDLFEELL